MEKNASHYLRRLQWAIRERQWYLILQFLGVKIRKFPLLRKCLHEIKIRITPTLIHWDVLKLKGSAQVRREIYKWDMERETQFLQDIDAVYQARKAHFDGIRVTVVMPTWNRRESIALAIDSVRAQTHENWELRVIDDGSDDSTDQLMAQRFAEDARIHYIPQGRQGVSAARNRGLYSAEGEYVFYLDTDNIWLPHYLRSMVVFMETARLDVAYAGIEAQNEKGQPLFYRGEEFDWESCLQQNYIDMNGMGHRRSIIAPGEGFDESLKRLVDWDLILRITAFHRVAFAPFLAVKYYNGLGGNRISNTEHQKDLGELRARVRAKHDPAKNPERRARRNRPNWRIIGWDLHPRRIGIKIPAPYDQREEWGDYHYAVSLQRQWQAMGHRVQIDFAGEWEKRPPEEDEVVVVLRGLARYLPKPQHLNIMWNISHPDQVPYWEYQQFDMVFVASLSYAAFLRTVIATPVASLLQCTDTARFHPRTAQEQVKHDVLFVGNSRNEYRPIVRWALETGADLAVYGTRWEPYIPARYIRGQNVDNATLGAYYAGARVVLNDHWASMREFGFVSNRVFDVLACGGNLISDPCPSLHLLFGEAVREVADAADMQAALTAHPPLHSLAGHVQERHSFARRGAALLEMTRDRLQGALPGARDDLAAASPLMEKTLPVLGVEGKGNFSAATYRLLISPLTSEALAGKILFDPDDPHARRIPLSAADGMTPSIDPRIWRDFRKGRAAIGRRKTTRMVYLAPAHIHVKHVLATILPALDGLSKTHDFTLTIIGEAQDIPDRRWLRLVSPPKEALAYPHYVRWLFEEKRQFDLGLAPAATGGDGTDRAFLEYAAMGVLPVLADIPAYRQHEGRALLARDTVEGWRQALEQALADVAACQPMVDKAQAYVWEERHSGLAGLELLKKLGID